MVKIDWMWIKGISGEPGVYVVKLSYLVKYHRINVIQNDSLFH